MFRCLSDGHVLASQAIPSQAPSSASGGRGRQDCLIINKIEKDKKCLGGGEETGHLGGFPASARRKLQSLGISTSLLREWTEREVAGPIPPDPDGSPLRAPLREALAVSPPNPDFDAGAGGDTEGAVRSTSAEGLLPPPALLPPPPALCARARGVSMAVEAGHRRDIGVRTRVRFAEGCLQGCRDAGSAGETEAAAVVVLAAVVAGTGAGVRSVSAAAAGGVGSPWFKEAWWRRPARQAATAQQEAVRRTPPPLLCGCRRLQPWTRRWCKTRRRWRPVWPTTTAQQEAFLQTPPPLLHSHRCPWPWTRRPIKAGSWTARPEWWQRMPSWTRFWPRRAERARPWRRTAPASSRRWVSGWTAVTLRKAAVDMLEQDDVLAGFAAAEGGAEYLAWLR